MATLELDGVSKVYDDAKGTERAVDDVSLTIDDGDFAVVVGPSGCGKTTLLRMVAGLESVTEGAVRMDGREVQRLAPGERDVAMVFQSYALYPKMTGRENMAYGLKHAGGMGAAERNERVLEAAEMLDVTDILDDRPEQMSGGQKQRIALGRALVRNPGVFLLDEPLSNLDAKLRSEMRRELQRIHEEFGITTVYVTHDQKEAMTMADDIAVMRDGRLQQLAPPERAYDSPANRFVGEFLGRPSMNLLDAEPAVADGDVRLTRGSDVLASVPRGSVSRLPDAVTVGFRPEHVKLSSPPTADGFVARKSVAEFQGREQFVHLSYEGEELTARQNADVDFAAVDEVGVSVPASSVYLFDAETGETLKTASE
jgi:multiple sugar transport system ATP-binding protein